MRKKERFIGECVDYTHDALGIVKKDGAVIFVKNLLVGETAEIEIIKVLKSYLVGRVIKLIKASSQRVDPVCPHFKLCGGCALMHMGEKAQQAFKTERALETFQRIAHIDHPVQACLMDPDPYHYRNKVQVPVGLENGRVVTGFYRPHTNEIVNNDFCFIQNEFSNEVTAFVKKLFIKYRIQPYDKVKRKGMIKHILTRYGVKSGEGMLVLISYTKMIPHLHDIVEEVTNKFDHVKTIIQNINPRHDNVILGEEERILYGQGYITDVLLGKRYKISMKSFYQINPRQVEVLYRSAIRMAHLSKEDIALDAYCGIGTISLSVADQVKKVYGIEVVPDAIRDARVNAANNQIDNAVFINGDAGKEALKLKSEHISFDVVFVDPPRKGCSELFLRQLVELTPERLIYISCNVATQARDMNILKDYYDILEIQPVDMFPETKSIENIVSMRRKKD